MNGFELPAELRIALAMLPEAQEKFSTLTERQKWEVVSGTHAVGSREEMKRYVENIIDAY